jgi:hypothetical protein
MIKITSEYMIILRKRILILTLTCALISAGITGFVVIEERVMPRVSRVLFNGENFLVKKAFPLLNILQKEEALKDVIQRQRVFSAISSQMLLRVEKSQKHGADVRSYASAIQWKENEIRTIGDELVKLYTTNSSFKAIIPALKKDGQYKLYEELSDTALIRNAWNDAALGINNIFDVYLQGKKPLYPAIDSISFQVNDEAFTDQVNEEFKALVQSAKKDKNQLFFQLPLKAALKVLAINGRDEAIRYEPLDKGTNESAARKIPTIDWNEYPYSVILVPGQGPSEEGVVLDPLSIYRCQLAAERYRSKLAPFLVVSGGHVHPNKTPYSEAVEMKKFLIDNLKIPEEDIFIEPHARHTTTNLRNTTRIIYRFGMPYEKPVLIVTSMNQNNYINGKMGPRGKKELGYFPYKELKKLSINESGFTPTLESLQANPFDILDP